MSPATEEEVQEALPNTAILPVCPHCGEDPVKLTLMFQKFPKGQIAAIVFCGSCRKMLPAQIVGMEDSRIVQPGKKN